MKTKGLLYSADMVRAWFSGRKWQTRRPIKGLPQDIDSVHNPNLEDPPRWWDFYKYGEYNTSFRRIKCPYEIGMKLYGRETWRPCGPWEIQGKCVQFRADNYFHPVPEAPDLKFEDFTKWRPSIHMPRWASRIHQTITGIRVERVCDISEEDAIAEGVNGKLCSEYILKSPCTDELKPVSVHAYAGLWQSIYGTKHPWESTWVWVIEYPRYEGAK